MTLREELKMNATDVLCCEVLVVGAGGIGCELLKNLVLENFGKITVIDLDTIDISNLNRQFLFQKIHVGRSKAEVAKESVMRFRPKCEITAFHKSIFSSVFDTDFFSRFDLVFNALDNHAARRHVNRMCVATKVPLIESGTAGYLGQVEPLIPSGLLSLNCVHDKAESNANKEDFRTGCYECQPRGSGQRTYPACTIRNTPSEPIHCVVWAKYLFNQLFGEPDVDDEDVSPDLTDPDLQHSETTVSKSTNEVINGSAPPKQVSGNTSVSRFADGPASLRDWFLAQWKEKNHEGQMLTAPRNLAWRLFHQDLVTLVGMRDLWVDRRDRREPSPLGSSILEEAVNHNSGLCIRSVSFHSRFR
ncbi:SUMO-activating enzyme subunit 2 [Paragonimus heterotremus]|uniref:SUMO-activating enzyme subunit 2 n=1 Tax=Paragonimus heterotremus TaxID=100268 RepID=A0A8J4WE63_9TREM|nr:SUMO-activating enzyme subunit 2 [Paragonimus heterotremus]